MRRIESAEDDARGVVTYDVGGGQRVRVYARIVQECGLARVLEYLGVEPPTGRVPVMQHGRQVGTVPAIFDPMFIRSTNPWYSPRQGDFVREGDAWVVSRTLGPGDLEAVPGFVWDKALPRRPATLIRY